MKIKIMKKELQDINCEFTYKITKADCDMFEIDGVLYGNVIEKDHESWTIQTFSHFDEGWVEKLIEKGIDIRIL